MAEHYETPHISYMSFEFTRNIDKRKYEPCAHKVVD